MSETPEFDAATVISAPYTHCINDYLQRVLAAQWRAPADILDDADIAALQQLWVESLREMVK